jgi:hypothetical protein
MLSLYKKTLLVSQTNPMIFQSTEIYWELDDHFDEIIEMQEGWAFFNTQIQEAAREGRKTLEEYTEKMDKETLIPYAAAVLDPHVKTNLLQAHLKEGAINVIDNLQAYFNEISPAPETLPPHQQDSTSALTPIATTSFVGRAHSLQVESNQQQMLREIQRKHYSTTATSQTDEINDWLESSPIQEPVPDNMTAEQDI